MDVTFWTDPDEFLERARPLLEAEPVVGSVIASTAHRSAAEARAGVVPSPDVPRWWATLTDGDRLVGLAMRTMPFAPFAVHVGPMRQAAARALAEALLDRGEVVRATNGEAGGARLVLERHAERLGGRVEESMRVRLWEARRVVEPPSPPGDLRVARLDDERLVSEWFAGFHAEADRQAGREPRAGHALDPAAMRLRIEQGRVRLWEVDGEVVHLVAVTPPAFGVVRLGPVYTPVAHRGHGYASAAVARVTAEALAAGLRPCLYTDRDNPTSGRIYAAVGYEGVVDSADLEVVTHG